MFGAALFIRVDGITNVHHDLSNHIGKVSAEFSHQRIMADDLAAVPSSTSI
jgi:hypothetical protein